MSQEVSVKINVTDALTISKSHLGTPYSPITPVSSSSSSKTNSLEPSSSNIYSVSHVFKQNGYIPLKRIGNTLQGSIWKVTTNDSNTPVNTDDDTFIIKVADKSLHEHSIAYINGNSIKISENIITETAILKYLVSDTHSSQVIKYHRFFCDKYNYFLVLEDGGTSLFHFVKECHQLIRRKVIDISEWHNFCRNAMLQMADALQWMHNTMDCCHLDISLENLTIKDIQSIITMNGNSKKITFCEGFQIKIIDFGLSEVFTTKHENGETDFRSTKFVGKTQYKAPEVYAKSHAFDARSADCWSLAVCFFMMFTGVPPFEKASNDDLLYTLIMNGRLHDVLYHWDMMDYVSDDIVDLFSRLFCAEKYRFTMTQIKQHEWFKVSK